MCERERDLGSGFDVSGALVFATGRSPVVLMVAGVEVTPVVVVRLMVDSGGELRKFWIQMDDVSKTETQNCATEQHSGAKWSIIFPLINLRTNKLGSDVNGGIDRAEASERALCVDAVQVQAVEDNGDIDLFLEE
ncbi:hypothetical protein RHMOL_Rhmol08G0305300 [Rhododendron molle]|uniref:Uncharacterized protein n=1 Tax=Rhododendron molle TaxID=49168 RepID=A0ACC0MVM2_RHOML|nr:hypothetical protein RHMOL_Rhmol08G0305300 [Rhododendron molle]